MARLVRSRRGQAKQHFGLIENNLVGRHPGCDLVLDHAGVSARHAALEWKRGWHISDLGSRNGTFVNRTRLKKLEARRLQIGDRLAFADIENEWVLAEDGAPQAVLISADREVVLPLDPDERARNLVPNDDQPRATVWRSGQSWTLEWLDGRRQSLVHAGAIELAEQQFIACLPGDIAETATLQHASTRRIESGRFEFFVANDEESAAVRMSFSDFECTLELRAHLYLLAMLARRRLADVHELGKPDNSAGWIHVEEACTVLGCASREHLAVMIHRARKHITQSMVDNPQDIVDRSLRGHLRIGVSADSLSVTRLTA